MSTQSPITAGYVRTSDGAYLIQRPADNPWGFELCNEDQTWPGGIVEAESWEVVDASEVPAEEQERLGKFLRAE